LEIDPAFLEQVRTYIDSMTLMLPASIAGVVVLLTASILSLASGTNTLLWGGRRSRTASSVLVLVGLVGIILSLEATVFVTDSNPGSIQENVKTSALSPINDDYLVHTGDRIRLSLDGTKTSFHENLVKIEHGYPPRAVVHQIGVRRSGLVFIGPYRSKRVQFVTVTVPDSKQQIAWLDRLL